MVNESSVYQDQSSIFRSLSEQLKTPFLQIRSIAESINYSDITQQNTQDIQTISGASLRLIDAYLLAAQHEYGQSELSLSPVSAAASLKNVAYMLEKYADVNGFDIDVSVRGKYEPVMAHVKGLEYAVFCLAHMLFDGGGELADADLKRPTLILGAHKTRLGISVGVYIEHWKNPKLLSLARAKRLWSKGSLQPLKDISPSNAGGFFIAESLVLSLGSTITSSKHKGARGIAFIVPKSQQMSLL